MKFGHPKTATKDEYVLSFGINITVFIRSVADGTHSYLVLKES
jgi:hypothetical protein